MQKVAVVSRGFNATCQDDGVTLARWQQDSKGLHRTFEFQDFASAWAFMNRVAAVAEKLDHHPDWTNSWNRVSITLISHDVARVTERDIEMAGMIDEIVDDVAGGAPK